MALQAAATRRAASHRKLQQAAQQRWLPPTQHAWHRRSRSVVARTSEFWYEEEEEFDAVTEILEPKRFCLVATQQCGASSSTTAALAGVPFVTAFASPAGLEDAERLWQQLGRGGPPLFLKVRSRAGLGKLEAPGLTDPEAAALADEFWGEVLTQSWRTELDYGLGKREEGGSVEAVLVVADPPALARLVSAATGGSSSNSSSGDDAGSGGSEDGTAAAAADGCVVVEVDGWNEGVAAEQQKILDSWRSLRPRLAGAKKGARASLH